MSVMWHFLCVVGVLGTAACGVVPAGEQSTMAPPLVEAGPVVESLPEGFYDQANGFATRVIEEYLETSDAITADRGEGSQRMQDLVSSSWFPVEEDGFAYYRATGERTVGKSVLETSRVQLARRTPEGILDIGVITCIDTTGVLVLGSEDPDPPQPVVDWLEKRMTPELPDDVEAIGDYFEQTSARPGDRRAIVFWLVGNSLDQLRVDHSEQWWGVTLCQ
jgi:hypothetical protein